MGVAVYITSQEHSAFVVTEVCGKALALSLDALDALAKEIGLVPLSGFLSADPKEAFSLMEVPEDLWDDQTAAEEWLGFKMPEEVWFEADTGLAVVRGLLNELETNPQKASFSEDVITDLKDCERVLEALKESGIRWHFSTDF